MNPVQHFAWCTLHISWISRVTNPVCCSMSVSNCCFLTCIQVSQEAGKVVWYSHLLKNFPQFVVIYTVKGFDTVNKAEIDAFLELSSCWVFQICWHIECSTFTESSFRICNSSTGIPSHPLAMFIAMLSKAHLTSHSRMFGSRWVISLSWLSGSWRSFLNSYSVYSYLLFLISSASVRSIPFLSVMCPSFHEIFSWYV